jgi:hypothetical protein
MSASPGFDSRPMHIFYFLLYIRVLSFLERARYERFLRLAYIPSAGEAGEGLGVVESLS